MARTVLCITSVYLVCSIPLSISYSGHKRGKGVKDTGEWCNSTIVWVKKIYLLRVVCVSKSITCLSSGFTLLMLGGGTSFLVYVGGVHYERFVLFFC